MIHFPDTPTNITTVMRAVRLPCCAFTAVFRPAICLGDEYVFCVELLQARGVWAHVPARHRVKTAAQRFDRTLGATFLSLLRSPALCCRPKRNKARIKVNDIDQAKVRRCHKQQEDRINSQDRDGLSRARFGTMEKVVD
jgi:hypothetical protein